MSLTAFLQDAFCILPPVLHIPAPETSSLFSASNGRKGSGMHLGTLVLSG